MKKWDVTYTFDKDKYESDQVEGTSYTDAYVNAMIKHPGAMITEIRECSNA